MRHYQTLIRKIRDKQFYSIIGASRLVPIKRVKGGVLSDRTVSGTGAAVCIME